MRKEAAVRVEVGQAVVGMAADLRAPRQQNAGSHCHWACATALVVVLVVARRRRLLSVFPSSTVAVVTGARLGGMCSLAGVEEAGRTERAGQGRKVA